MPTSAKSRSKAAKRHTRAKPAAKRSVRRKAPPAPPQAREGSKKARLIAALQSASGATIAQLTKLTGWQSHSVRGVISGALRKRLGLNVLSTVEGEGPRTYRIVGSHAS